MNKRLLIYLPSIISLICIFFYFTPWLIAANHANLGLYIISFLWFLIAWIIMFVKIVRIIWGIFKKKSLDKHRIFSALLILLCYVIIVIGMMNDYMVTV